MEFRHDLTYDATLAEVSAMLDDPAYRDRVMHAQGGVSGTFEPVSYTHLTLPTIYSV